MFFFTSCAESTADVSETDSTATSVATTQTPLPEYTEAVRTNNRASFTKTQVLVMYKQAVDLVKLRCPGFARALENEIYEINAQGTSAALLNAAVAVLTEDDRSSDSYMQIAHGDDLACRTYFPVYDTDYGCRIYDGASVADAMCYEDAYSYELIIVFHEQTDATGISPEFAQMMTPFSSETLMRNLNAYIPALNENNCNASLRYYNCEIRCKIDKKSGHLLSLSQKMVTQLQLNITLDLVLAEPFFSAQATMINHLDFTDFIWH